MPRENHYVIGAAEPVVDDKAPLWPIALVIVAVGVAIALSWQSGSEQPTEAQATQQDLIEAKQAAENLEATLPPSVTPTTTAARVVSPPLAERVPGFEDVLIIALSDASGGSAYHLVWAPTANSGSRVSTLDDAEFDVSGAYFARLEGSTWNETLLGVGELVSQVTGPLAIGVESFVWHSSDPSKIAWVADVEGGNRGLFTADVLRENGNGVAQVSSVQEVGQADLLAWDRWGFALQGPGELLILDADGAERQRIPGATFLGSASDESLMVRVGGLTLVTSVSETPSEEPTWSGAVRGRIIGTFPNPTNSVMVVTSIDGDTVLNYEINPNGARLLELNNNQFQTWSSDGAFAIFTGSGEGGSEVLFYKPSTFETFVLEVPDAILSVFTRG